VYSLARPFLFCLDAEKAHDLGLAALEAAYRTGLNPLLASRPAPLPTRVFGIDFPNPVGLAAGLDKNAAHIDALAAMGFGFIEVGTVTPKGQPGNPKPRMFRLPEHEAVINRLGFNNGGVDALLRNVEKAKFSGVLGINIGKNKDTPNERASDDYLLCLQQVYAHADYVAVNISSPNTPGLRDLQYGEALDRLLDELKEAQTRLADHHGRYVPLALKIAPDLDAEQIAQIAAALRRHRIDAVIATNTTLARDKVQGLPFGDQQGGLSGAPLFEASTAVVAALARALQNELPIIAAGGVAKAKQARAKLDAGARLVQLYSGLIYRGPALVRESVAETRDFA